MSTKYADAKSELLGFVCDCGLLPDNNGLFIDSAGIGVYVVTLIPRVDPRNYALRVIMDSLKIMNGCATGIG